MSSDRHINRDNYEEFFVDWLDGNLDPSLLPSFMQFLEDNPDLAELLRETEHTVLRPEKPVPPIDKASLKKKVEAAGGVNEANFEQKAVAAMEGELKGEEQKELERFLEMNPAYRHDMALYEQTRLMPDLSVVYPGKERLKRRPLLFAAFVRFALPAAAAVLLLLLLWRVFIPTPTEEPFLTPLTSVEPSRASEAKIVPSAKIPDLQELQPEIASAIPAASADSDQEIRLAGRAEPVTTMAAIHTRLEIPAPENGINYVRQAAILPDLTAQADNREKTGLLGRIIRNYSGKAVESTYLIRETVIENNPAEDLTFWSLAELGVKSFNRMADREVALTVIKDHEGTPREYLLREDDRVLLSRSLNQP